MIFTDLNEFHKNAIRFCSGPCKCRVTYLLCKLVHSYSSLLVWKRLFRSAWKNFGTQFKGIIERLVRHRNLIQSQAEVAHIEQSQRHFEISQEQSQRSQEHFRRYQADILEIQDRLRKNIEEEEQKKQLAVIEWLSAANSLLDYEVFCSTRSDYPGTGDWILQHNFIRNWKDEQEPESPIVWMNGIPGAGMHQTSYASSTMRALNILRQNHPGFRRCGRL